MSEVRVRFAPSPTGFLHIGSLGTILFDYFLAKSTGGKFILRIEDTDRKREVAGAAEKLIEILKWLEINFDEGPGMGGEFGPYVQSERQGIYDKYRDELLSTGMAYHCFCSSERIAQMKTDQMVNKQPPRYDRTCRDLSKEEVERRIAAGESYVIRQKMPLEGEVVVHDELHGDIKFKAENLEDHVLIKSDGIPTYQFASVVDDHLMQTSHVLRGDEWISSFPKNILLYQAFGWTPPKFIHVPLILNKEGGKLSKRQGDVAVEDFRAKGYLPEALINFCALLGWHPKGDQEILTREEIIKEFRIEDIGTSPAIFDLEKLDYLNGYYIRHKKIDELVALCKPHLLEILSKVKDERRCSQEFLHGVIGLEQERLKKLSDIAEATEFFFFDDLEYEQDLLLWKKFTAEEIKTNLTEVQERLKQIPTESWTRESIEEALMTHLKAKGKTVGEYLWPLRVSLTGRKASPGPFEVAEVLGKELTLARILGGVERL